MADLKLAVTERGSKDKSYEAYVATVIIEDQSISEIRPDGSGSEVILKDGVKYKSAKTINAIGAGLSAAVLT